MDELGGLEKKLEEVISLVKSFGPEDRVQAGVIWNVFSAQMQAIINSTIETEEIETPEETTPTKVNNHEIDNSKDESLSSQISSQSRLSFQAFGESDVHKDGTVGSLSSSCSQEKEYSVSKNFLSDFQFDKVSVNCSLTDDDGSCTIGTIDSATIGEDSQLTADESLSMSEIKDPNPTGTEEGGNQSTGDKPVEKKQLICDICSESAENETELKRHVKMNHKKTFTCNECDASFSKKGNLNVHKRKHTGDRPFPCPKCTNRFTTSGNLRRHLLSHQGLKPYSCSTCQARFTEKRNLLIHVRTHTGEKPYECPVCHKKFAHSAVLAQHKSIHKNLKPHLCHQCGKSFTQKSQLKVHEKRHSGVKSHVCQFCDSSFTTRSDLLRHQKTHTGEKPFVCTQCGKSFARSYTLKEHLNTKHPIEIKSN